MKYFKTFEDFHNSVTKALHNSIVRCSYNACIMKKGDMELAEQVIRQENQVDELQMAIDLECTQILALRQPKALLN